MKQLVYLLVFLPFISMGRSNPCEVDTYPIIWEKSITPSPTYELPAIYTERNGIKSIVSVSNAYTLIYNSMNSHKPYLKEAKEHILQKLKNIKLKQLVNERQLWIDLDGLQGQKLNVAIHVMAGYQSMFVEALLENIASIETNASLGTTTKATFMKGIFQGKDQTTNSVNNLLIRNDSEVIYQDCWLD